MHSVHGSMWRGHAAGVILGAVALRGVATADTICVPDDYETIQEAIDAATDGDQICVARGTYNEAIDLLGKAVRLYGTEGPEVTMIDGQYSRGTVVKCVSGEGPETMLEGFTITGGLDVYGGGMHCGQSGPTVENCTFTGNTAMFGGGMQNWLGSTPTVTRCKFIGNTAEGGAGLFIGNGGRAIVTDCVFLQNVAVASGDEWGVGGGVFAYSEASAVVINCTFIGNEADRWGGALYSDASRTTVTNCTFVANSAEGGRAVACDAGPSDVALANCILWDGGEEVHDGNGSAIVITYSDVADGYAGAGNIDADPRCDGDGRPQSGSPCIDAGASNAVPADLLDLDDDDDRTERVPRDLDGNHRFMDDGGTVDTGCGPVVVDMGAFEFPGEPVHPVLIGDIDGDGTVGFDDLIQVLSRWGECDPACCPADVDFTWGVDFDDLLIVLHHWS